VKLLTALDQPTDASRRASAAVDQLQGFEEAELKDNPRLDSLTDDVRQRIQGGDIDFDRHQHLQHTAGQQPRRHGVILLGDFAREDFQDLGQWALGGVQAVRQRWKLGRSL
jgi:hypothetical protein